VHRNSPSNAPNESQSGGQSERFLRVSSFAFSAFLYRYRNLIERYFGKIKHARGIATRYDKRADNFLAAIKLFSARLWINAYESMA
jgi:transposase